MNRRPIARWMLGLAVLSASSSAMCARPGEPSAGVQAASYTTNGLVKSIDLADKSILLKHEDIPGFMRAMTMLFELKDAEQAKGLAAGDSVTFTFTDEGNGRLVIQSIRKAP